MSFVVAKPTMVKIHTDASLQKVEAKYRNNISIEVMPFAIDTSYTEIATHIIRPDLSRASYSYRLFEVVHLATVSLQAYLIKIKEFFEFLQSQKKLDLLSVSGRIVQDNLCAIILIRNYEGYELASKELTGFLGETFDPEDSASKVFAPAEKLHDRRRRIHYTDEQVKRHQYAVAQQRFLLETATTEHPFLNSLDSYTALDLPQYETDIPPLYLLKEQEKRYKTVLNYDKFSEIFNEAVRYINGIEQDTYYNILMGKSDKQALINIMEDYLVRTFVTGRKTLPKEDLSAMMEKLQRAFFELYVVQDLINDDDITDIKITDPYTIRVRIRGKAYLSDVTFVDGADYLRFVQGLIIRNNIDPNIPEQTFTDNHDENNILRFTITMPYITANHYPVLHIRKVSRKKLMADDLIAAGMFDEKIRDYLLDCGRHSTGVVFAGSPGSGKTICLNWFLEEAYEDSSEILVIQENDELFSYKKGIIFQHVVNNPTGDRQKCTLEDLGQLALVAGANVFVIGEAKGAEICSAITLANSGCRTAMTIHSRSSTETIDKMADLALRGYAQSFEQAKRMMKCFQTIVYMKDFKICEISEILGYDEEKKDMIYRPIYRREIETPIDSVPEGDSVL